MLSATKPSPHFTKDHISWEQFQAIAAGFTGIPLVRLNYCEGILEIMPISRQHEIICAMLSAFLISYCTAKGISFIPTGAYTQSVPPHTEFQADLSFTLGENKEVSDLCIEVVITSGSINKLRKYELRGVPEVWFWEEGKISIFYLHDQEWRSQTHSTLLPDLDIAHLETCLLMDSQLEAMQTFLNKYSRFREI